MSTENWVLLVLGVFIYLAVGFRVASAVLMDASGWHVPILWVVIALAWLPAGLGALLLSLMVGG